MSLIDETLARILVCPLDRGDLTQDVANSELVCVQCDRRYPVRDGIAVMLVDEVDSND